MAAAPTRTGATVEQGDDVVPWDKDVSRALGARLIPVLVEQARSGISADGQTPFIPYKDPARADETVDLTITGHLLDNLRVMARNNKSGQTMVIKQHRKDWFARILQSTRPFLGISPEISEIISDAVGEQMQIMIEAASVPDSPTDFEFDV